VILHGANYDEAYERAVEHGKQDNLTLIHAFDDDAVIAGQGTLGLEILEQQRDIEVVVAPIGGGGLIGGIACAVKEMNPAVPSVWSAAGQDTFDEGRDRARSSGNP